MLVNSALRLSEASSTHSTNESSSGPDPLISIGIPAYNSERFVGQSLQSLLAQDYENLEIMVSDDGSSDGTTEICAEFARADSRVVTVAGPHRGAAENFNSVLKSARGEYFMWAADHDLWHPRYVSTCVSALQADPNAVLAYSRSVLIDGNGNVLGGEDDALWIRQERPIDRYRTLIWRLENCNAIYGLMRCGLLKETGGYGPHPAPDHLVLAKMALKGAFIQVPETLYFRRRNRPPETPKEQMRRQLFDLVPEAAPGWLSRPQEEHFRELRDGHLAAIRAAPIPVVDKVRGLISTIACFNQRFGVRSRVWPGPGRILSRMPATLLGAGKYQQ